VAQGRETTDHRHGEEAPVPGVVLVSSALSSGLGAGHARRPQVLADGAVSLVIGRTVATASGRVVLDDDRLSREHAAVERVGAEWVVRDLSSRNGTYVDGRRISEPVQVRGDVVVRCGHSVLLLLGDVRDRDRDLDVGDVIVGPELARVLAEAAGATALLVQGELGSGKKVVARHVHATGAHPGGPFVAVDCTAAIDSVGGPQTTWLTPLADAFGGTLFLDHVSELDLALQARLLRAIEGRDGRDGGGGRVAVVAASDRDLRGAVASRRFRSDLYYRLARTVVMVPPLRQRRGDIPRFVARALGEVSAELGVELLPHPRLIETCCLRPWPGNVPELMRAVADAARAAHAASRDRVRPDDLPSTAGAVAVDESTTSTTTGPRPKVSPAEVDRTAVEAAMSASSGNVSAAARALGLHRTQLYRLLQRFGLDRPGEP
jgi:hypothetical protein